jgi:hypothetical protein
MVRDVRLGEHKRFARNSYNSLIRSAARGIGKFYGHVRYVGADDGKIAATEFPNVWATAATWGFCPALMGIRAESLYKLHIHAPPLLCL